MSLELRAITDAAIFRATTINHIAKTRMSHRREMHSYLMRAAGFGNHDDERRLRRWLLEALDHDHVADRLARGVRVNRHPFAIRRMTPEGVRYCHSVARDYPIDNRQVDFLHRARLELRRQRRFRKGRPRDHHHTRSFLI